VCVSLVYESDRLLLIVVVDPYRSCSGTVVAGTTLRELEAIGFGRHTNVSGRAIPLRLLFRRQVWRMESASRRRRFHAGGLTGLEARELVIQIVALVSDRQM